MVNHNFWNNYMKQYFQYCILLENYIMEYLKIKILPIICSSHILTESYFGSVDNISIIEHIILSI